MTLKFLKSLTMLLCLIGLNTAGSAAEITFPSIAADNLNGEPTTIPSGAKEVVIVAFEREQQDDVDGWIDGLKLAQSRLIWHEVPLIDNPGAIMRWVISNGMHNGIPDRAKRSHIVTWYTDKENFLKAVNITDLSSCYVFVLGADGKILTSIFGPYSGDNMAKIQAFIE